MSLPKNALVAAVYALALAWVLGKAALFRARVPPGIPPDETAHVSFAAQVEAAGSFVPRYEEGRLLDDAGRPGPLPNYLAHPALYYAALSALDRTRGDGRGATLAERTRALRVVSAPLFAVAAGLFLWLGLRRDAPPAGHAAWAATVAAVPPFAFVGAAVNNDVLAWLGGGILLLGLARRLEGRVDAGTGTLVGAGLALSLLAKATAGLLALLVAAAALSLARRQAPARPRAPFLLPVALGLLLPAFHWLPVLLRYGTPIPSLKVVDPEAFARSAFVAPAGGELLALLPWLWKMTRLAASTALSIVSHDWVPVGPPASLAGPALLAGLALLGLLPAAARPGRERSAELPLARAGLLALAATFALNLLWARTSYLETGRLGGVHARYYLPLLPCVALAVSLGLERLPGRGILAAGLVLLLVLFDAGVAARFLALFAGP